MKKIMMLATLLMAASSARATDTYLLRLWDKSGGAHGTIDGSNNMTGVNLNAPDLTGTLGTGVKISTANISPGFNEADELIQLNGSGQIPVLDGSLLQGVSASSATSHVSAPITGDGTSAHPLGLDNTVTTAGNSFNGASQLIKTDASSHYCVNGVCDYGAMTDATMEMTACAEFVSGTTTCRVMSADDFDIYTATAADAGAWRNNRNGVAP